MASLTMAMYDYNGAMYAFGVVGGLGNKDIKAVRMYVSTGTGTTYSYLSTQIYDSDTARLNSNYYNTPGFVFNVRTDRDYDVGSPRQLNYWILDENGDGYGRYKFSFSFYSDESGETAYLINKNVLRPTMYDDDGNLQTNVYYQMHNSLNSPAIEWDSTNKKIKVKNMGNYRHMIEIRRKDRNKVNTSFSAEVKDYAYTVGMKNLESGKYYEAIPITSLYDASQSDENVYPDQGNVCRYRTIESGKEQKALVVFDSGAKFTTNQRNTYLQMVTDALNYLSEKTSITFSIDNLIYSDYIANNYKTTMNNLVEQYGAYEDNDYEYDVIIRIGNNTTMKGNWVGQGVWGVWRWPQDPEWGIANSVANINVERSQTRESVRHVIFEEIYQSFGIGADNYEYPLSIHYDPEYLNPDSYDIVDAYNDGVKWDDEILRFWYTQDMNGWTNVDLLNQMDTPCTMFKEYDKNVEYYEFDLSDLYSDEYVVEAWIAGEKSNPNAGGTSEFYYWHGGWDDSPYSLKSSIEISISDEYIPTNLRCTRIKKGFIIEWDSVNGASGYNLQILKNGEIVSQYKNTKVLSQTLNWLDCATEYTIQVQSVKSDGTTSSWAVLTTATAPSIPIVSVISCGSNSVNGTWTLEDFNSNFTYLYVTLYPVEG